MTGCEHFQKSDHMPGSIKIASSWKTFRIVQSLLLVGEGTKTVPHSSECDPWWALMRLASLESCWRDETSLCPVNSSCLINGAHSVRARVYTEPLDQTLVVCSPYQLLPLHTSPLWCVYIPQQVVLPFKSCVKGTLIMTETLSLQEQQVLMVGHHSCCPVFMPSSCPHVSPKQLDG
jgi:hypothetical protein